MDNEQNSYDAQSVLLGIQIGRLIPELYSRTKKLESAVDSLIGVVQRSEKGRASVEVVAETAQKQVQTYATGIEELKIMLKQGGLEFNEELGKDLIKLERPLDNQLRKLKFFYIDSGEPLRRKLDLLFNQYAFLGQRVRATETHRTY
jgi:hypothetical protein